MPFKHNSLTLRVPSFAVRSIQRMGNGLDRTQYAMGHEGKILVISYANLNTRMVSVYMLYAGIRWTILKCPRRMPNVFQTFKARVCMYTLNCQTSFIEKKHAWTASSRINCFDALLHMAGTVMTYITSRCLMSG